jgi:L-seryl-tRNA(Ser) seleniumtransferase
MLVALELYLRQDERAETRELNARAQTIVDQARRVRGVETEVELPAIANHVPHVHIWWDSQAVPLTVEQVVERLRDGDPRIEVTPSDGPHLVVNPWMLREGEAEVVARRIREILQQG